MSYFFIFSFLKNSKMFHFSFLKHFRLFIFHFSCSQNVSFFIFDKNEKYDTLDFFHFSFFTNIVFRPAVAPPRRAQRALVAQQVGAYREHRAHRRVLERRPRAPPPEAGRVEHRRGLLRLRLGCLDLPAGRILPLHGVRTRLWMPPPSLTSRRLSRGPTPSAPATRLNM